VYIVIMSLKNESLWFPIILENVHLCRRHLLSII
jgi:hypothetical protein